MILFIYSKNLNIKKNRQMERIDENLCFFHIIYMNKNIWNDQINRIWRNT